MALTGSGTSTSSPAYGTGSYTLAQVIDRIRYRLDDTSETYLWSNQEITNVIDALQKQLVAEMPILEDGLSDDVCEVSLVQGDGLIDIPMSRIVKITKARLDGKASYLTICDSEYMDANHGDWQGEETAVEQGIPNTLVISGFGPGKVYLYPPLSSATATLKMTVYRLPLLDLEYAYHSAEYLEVDKFVHLLDHGILWQLYLKTDSDTYDPKKAEQHRVYWEGNNGMGGDKEKIRRMVLKEKPTGSAVEFNKALY